MRITNISETKAQLSKLIERVSRGEEVVIGKAGRPVARLVPFDPQTEPRTLHAVWAGQVEIAEDFDELPAEFLGAFSGDDEPAA